MDNRPIGIFDSGVGGLTVYKEIKKVMPNENYIYVGDTQRFPYGNKSKESIIEISKAIVDYLISRNVKLVVIACGTATSQALQELQRIYRIPIIGIIEPTIKNKIDSNTKKIGIIATRGTIKSKAWEEKILEKNSNVEIISKSTPMLAPMAEEGWTTNIVAKYTIKEYMREFEGKKIEKLILGCTHYPLFIKFIREELGNEVDIVNTGEQIAIYLEKYMQQQQIKNIENIEPKEEFYLTDTNGNFIEVAKQLLGRKIAVNRIEI